MVTFGKRKDISPFLLFRLDIGISHGGNAHSIASEIWEGERKDEVKSIYKPLAIGLKDVSSKIPFLDRFFLCFISHFQFIVEGRQVFLDPHVHVHVSSSYMHAKKYT